MPDYSLFTASDFAFDPAFKVWVTTPTPTTERFWQDYLLNNPDKRADVQLARQVVLGIGTDELPQVDQQQIDHDVARMLARIQEQAVTPPVAFRVSRGRTYLWWAAAAAIVLTVGLGWLATHPKTSEAELTVLEAETGAGKPVYANASAQPMLVRLPDGSTVTLSPRSTLQHEPTFGTGVRDIVLTGEAFFSVVRNEKRPFRVFTDDIVTSVLGTSFRVSAYPKDRQMTVTVRTGKVAVYARNDAAAQQVLTGNVAGKNVVLLTPNQAVMYSRATHKFHKTLINNPVPIGDAPAADAFVFDETPIAEVFERLEKTYGIPIDYDKKRLRDCALTASLTNENLTDKLTAICKGIEGHYEIVEGRVVIQSAGCH